MSMKDWDFGYFGKGLDGYVHFRQGMKEIESHSRPLRKASPAARQEEKRNDTWYTTVGIGMVVFAILAVLMCSAGIATVDDISNVVVTAIPVLGAAEIIQRIVWAYMNK